MKTPSKEEVTQKPERERFIRQYANNREEKGMMLSLSELYAQYVEPKQRRIAELEKLIEKAYDAGGDHWSYWLRNQDPNPAVIEPFHPVVAKHKWLKENLESALDKSITT